MSTSKETDTKETSPTGKLSSHFVAYLDFLGFEEKMKTGSSVTLKKLDRLLRIAKKSTKTSEHLAGMGFKTKYFSDNILVAIEIDQQKVKNQIKAFSIFISVLQEFALLNYGFLMRGGITVGELEVSNNIVWGPALVEAYEMENKLAIYPRIIVSKKFIDLYPLQIKPFFNRDSDGLWFINYLDFEESEAKKGSNVLKTLIEEHSGKSMRIQQNLNWVLMSFNSCCDRDENLKQYKLPLLNI